jgi:hypothetical protein
MQDRPLYSIQEARKLLGSRKFRCMRQSLSPSRSPVMAAIWQPVIVIV